MVTSIMKRSRAADEISKVSWQAKVFGRSALFADSGGEQAFATAHRPPQVELAIAAATALDVELVVAGVGRVELVGRGAAGRAAAAARDDAAAAAPATATAGADRAAAAARRRTAAGGPGRRGAAEQQEGGSARAPAAGACFA